MPDDILAHFYHVHKDAILFNIFAAGWPYLFIIDLRKRSALSFGRMLPESLRMLRMDDRTDFFIE